MKVNLDVEKYHRIGSHCLTTTIQTLLRYQGIDFSEEMILGLGSGIGFTYVRQKDAFIFGGRGGNLEINLGSSCGFEVEIEQFDDADYAWVKAKEKIDNGYPQILDLNMFYLDYIKQKLHMAEGLNFSGHKIILTGYDEENKVAYVLDYLWRNNLMIEIGLLKAARDSKIKPGSPNNASITIIKPKELYPLEFSIKEAIDYNVQQMLYPVGYGLGLKAITRFFAEIKCWPDILSKDRLKRELFMAHMAFEKVGTGGGNFRRMYSRFLKTCSKILNNSVLMDVSNIYAQLGRLWKIYANKLYEASCLDEPKEAELFRKNADDAIEKQILPLEYQGIEKLGRDFCCRS